MSITPPCRRVVAFGRGSAVIYILSLPTPSPTPPPHRRNHTVGSTDERSPALRYRLLIAEFPRPRPGSR